MEVEDLFKYLLAEQLKKGKKANESHRTFRVLSGETSTTKPPEWENGIIHLIQKRVSDTKSMSRVHLYSVPIFKRFNNFRQNF